MKEAAGEANITVITIVLIGLVAAAGAIIIPRLLGTVKARACCSEYGGTWEGGQCVGSTVMSGNATWTMTHFKSNSTVKTVCGND